MKKYTIKNYKGNLIESLSRFAKSHKGMKIVEACEDEDGLKIKTKESKKIDEDKLDFDNFGGKKEVVNNIKKWIDKKKFSKAQIKQEFKDQETFFTSSWAFTMAHDLGFADNPYEWNIGGDEADFIEKTFNNYLKSKMTTAPARKEECIEKLIKYIFGLMQNGLDIQDIVNKLRKNKEFEINPTSIRLKDI